MPPWDPGLPPIIDAFLIALSIILIGGGGIWISLIGRNVKAVKAQTENEHANAEFPNLRDELSAVLAEVRGLRQDVGGIRAEIRTERDERRDVSKRLDAHLDEVPALTADAITKGEAAHVVACPLRNPRSPE